MRAARRSSPSRGGACKKGTRYTDCVVRYIVRNGG